MKKILIVAATLTAVIAATSCGNSKLTEEQERNYRLNDSLQMALANADSMFSVLYDVTTGLEQISQLEHLMQAPINAEGPSARQDIEAQMIAVQQGLIQRRQRIEELESQLGAKASENSKLRQQLNALRSQIDAQAATVADLTEKLNAANFRITVLSDSVVGLQTEVETVTTEKNRAEEERIQAVNELNAVYYVIGTNKELKARNFISGGGFMSKGKVLEGDFDRNYMTRDDKRTLSSLQIDSRSAKILTNQPKDSYRLEKDGNGNQILIISDPNRFWAATNLLVIEVK